MWNDIFFCFPFWVEEAYVWSVESADQMNPGTHVSFLNKVLGKSSKSRHTLALKIKAQLFFRFLCIVADLGPVPWHYLAGSVIFLFLWRKKSFSLLFLCLTYETGHVLSQAQKIIPKKGEICKPQGTIFGRPRIRIRLHQNDRTVWRLFTL